LGKGKGALLPRGKKSIRNGLRKGRSEYFDEVIGRALNGEIIAGNFGTLISKAVGVLSKSLSFLQLDFNERVLATAKHLKDLGHTLQEHPHVFCMVGGARYAIQHANCTDGNAAHTDKASARRCDGCKNGLCTSGHLENYDEELKRLAEQANDLTIAPSTRLRLKEAYSILDDIKSRHVQLQHTTTAAFRKLTDSWPSIVLGVA